MIFLKDCIMGIDMGTSNIKVGVFNLKGALIYQSKKQNIAINDNEYYKYDRLKILKTLYLCIKDVLEYIKDKYNVLSIGISGMAESGLPVDTDGKPLMDIIPWFDNRNEKQLKFCKSNFDPYYIYKKTGLKIQTKCPVLKIMWIKDNYPDIYNKMAYWLCVEDYVICEMTGIISTEVTIANRTMAMDVNKLSWSDDILKLCGLKENIFPDIYNTGSVVGTLKKDIAQLTGLTEGIPVSGTGHDHLCASFILGAVNSGDILNSMGTAESLIKINDKLMVDRNSLNNGFSGGRHVLNDKFYTMGGINNSGGTVNWFFKNVLGCNDTDLYKKIREFNGMLDDIPSEIVFLPHLLGCSVPHDPDSKASFIGLVNSHTKLDMLKSVYEGLSLEFKKLLKNLQKNKYTSNSLIATGGSTNNKKWMQIKADILGKDILIPHVDEAVCLGSAVLGGIGSKIYYDYKEALNKICYDYSIIKYNRGANKKYNAIYNEIYSRLYDCLSSINKTIGKVID